MVWLSLAIGIALVALMLVDFLHSTITTRGPGPITRPTTNLLWRLVAHTRWPRRYAGPLILSATAAVWIGGTWLGWTLIFAAADGVLRPPDGLAPPGFGDKAAFVVSLLSTLGLGVFTPTAMPWHLAAGFAAMHGMIVLTLSVSYVLNVLQTAVSGRAFAFRMQALGNTPEDILLQGSRRGGLDGLATHLTGLTPTVVNLGQQLKSYPLAACFDRGPDDFNLLEATLRLKTVLKALPDRDLGDHELRQAAECLCREAALSTDSCATPELDHARLRAEGLPV